MKQTIPFTKDITFKTKIGDLTSISLDNDLTLKGEDLIVGSFYIKGTYKDDNLNEEEYSYKIPCEIAISDDYDTYDSTIDIDDFHYEIINDEILRVYIVVLIDNLIKKEKEVERCIDLEELEEVVHDIKPNPPTEVKEEIKEIVKEEVKEEKRDIDSTINIVNEEKENIIQLTKEENYLTYRVYIVNEEDTLEKIITKYKVTKEQLKDYNDIDNFTVGTKLIIPSTNND